MAAPESVSLPSTECSTPPGGGYDGLLSGSTEAMDLYGSAPTHEAALPGAVPSHPSDILWSPVSAPAADALSAAAPSQGWATATSNSPVQLSVGATGLPPPALASSPVLLSGSPDPPGSVGIGSGSGLGTAAELVSDSDNAPSESGDSDAGSGIGSLRMSSSRMLFAQSICKQTNAVPPPDSGGGSAPCPRFGHTAVVHKDLMIVYGGRDAKCYDDVWAYCFVTKRWRHIKPTQPESDRPRARAGHTAVVYNGAMYLFGGVAEAEPGSHTLWLNDFWMLDLNSWRWSEVRSRGVGRPDKRKGHTAVVHKRSMFVFGGGQDETRMNRDLWEFNFATSKWIERHFTGHEPQERMYHVSAVGHGGRLLVFGGRAQTSTGFLNDLFEVDLSTFKCQLLTPSGPAPTHRMCSTAVYHNHTLAIFTGGSYAYLEDSFQLDLRKMQWMPIDSIRVGGRTRPTTVKWRNTVLTFGGCVHGNGYVNDFIELELEPMSLQQCVKQYLTEHRISLRDPAIPRGVVDFLDE
eukprot:Hpha_TRINITY_DN17008_c0_g1::TRINITY_DN17008_c0_g1_i1::g.166960::m.166960